MTAIFFIVSSFFSSNIRLASSEPGLSVFSFFEHGTVSESRVSVLALGVGRADEEEDAVTGIT